MQENCLCVLSLRLDIGDAHTYGIGPYIFQLKNPMGNAENFPLFSNFFCSFYLTFVASTLALLSCARSSIDVCFGNIQSEYLVEFIKHINENRKALS